MRVIVAVQVMVFLNADLKRLKSRAGSSNHPDLAETELTVELCVGIPDINIRTRPQLVTYR